MVDNKKDSKTKIEQGDLVKIELTGRLFDGSVFETTDENVAKKNEIWSNTSKYGPRLVVIGRGAMIAGLEEEIPKMKVGDYRKVHVACDKGFGSKHAELVRVMPQKEFEKRGVRAVAGLMVTLDGVPAMIKSVSSGRVMLDFNHPLAGEELEYEVKLLEIISEPDKKANELANQFGAKIKIEQKDGKNSIVVQNGIENSKLRGLEASLHACIGDWATITTSN
jgi:FKBP-type peptidyl-prolyl cis-trans isomerase SlyD